MPFGIATAIAGVAGVAATAYASKKEEDAANNAADAQRGQNEASQRFVEGQSDKSRKDALLLSGLSQRNAISGAGGMHQALSGSAPAAFDAMQQGNMNAQNTILAGTPQLRNALMGRQVDTSGMRAKGVTPDFSFLQQPMPEFTTTDNRQADNINRLFNQHLGRDAGNAGIQAFTDMMTHKDEQTVIDAIKSSGEYTQKNSGASVNDLFNQYLGRDAGEAGRQAFTDMLATQGEQAVIGAIQSSDEYIAKQGGGS